MKKRSDLMIGMFLLVLLIPLVSAGVGIKWDKESILLGEGEEACITYSAYNPFEGDTNARIELSEELSEVLITQETETIQIPGETGHEEAIPVEFCFRAPRGVYKKDCLFLNMFCEQKCEADMKEFAGEVAVVEISDSNIEGEGGSATTMAVAAPLNVRIKCNPHTRDFSLIYIVVALIALIIIITIVSKRLKHKKKR
jgi:hypothetical protein